MPNSQFFSWAWGSWELEVGLWELAFWELAFGGVGSFRDHRPVNFALRFSRNAAVPSCLSSDE
jgi:hypothetical protein